MLIPGLSLSLADTAFVLLGALSHHVLSLALQLQRSHGERGALRLHGDWSLVTLADLPSNQKVECDNMNDHQQGHKGEAKLSKAQEQIKGL